jgi:Flp pilus assembly protein TadG
MSLIDRVFGRRGERERGVVVALMGVLLPVLGLLTMFAIDTAHWWDYSRNLQSRADAAALAAGLQYGNTCATTTPDAAAMAKVGEVAQLYSGPQSTSDLPYDYATTATDFAPTTYQNLPTLKAGTPDRYHVFINASGPWKTGQQSFNHWPGHSGIVQSFTHGSICSASYADDQGGVAGPITDIWVTQDNVPQFFRFVDLHPSISAHARVELQQGDAGGVIRPVAVRDSTAGGLVSCITVKFVRDDGSNTVIKTMTLTKDATGDPKFPSGVLWDNLAGDSFTMPAANVIMQPTLGCGADAAVYNDTTNTGLLYINTYGTATPAAGEAPRITTSGVDPTVNGVLLGGACTSDQYFSSQTCLASVTADVAFAPNPLPYTAESVTAVDTSTGTTLPLAKLSTSVKGVQNLTAGQTLNVQSGGTAGFAATGSIDVDGVSYAYSGIKNAQQFTLTVGGTFADNAVVTQTGDNRWTSGVAGFFSIPVQDGRHPIRIDWAQRSGSVGGAACTGVSPCTGTFGMQQQAFGACSACDAPDDSGPIVALRLRLQTDARGVAGRNFFQVGSNPNLVVELVFQGLGFDKPDPATKPQVLRVGTSTDKATGLIDCGQGSGANADADAITNGCPLVNSADCKNSDFCAPLKAYDATKHPLGTCNPLLRQTADPAYADCVDTISGTRRSKIPGAVAGRIVQSGTCAPNNWTAYATDPKKNPIPGADPRAFLFIITQPADLTKNSIVPIKTFATFYVTGWDTGGSNPTCSPANINDPFPGVGKSTQNGAIWGHWIEYTDPTVSGNGTFCDPTLFGVCASVLTR